LALPQHAAYITIVLFTVICAYRWILVIAQFQCKIPVAVGGGIGIIFIDGQQRLISYCIY
ncbi:MAG: hypothetical protein J0I84_00225, partial [Terrimonas sp.]|nr:hypothetical protein [Terrimonas sp.]